MVYDFVVGAKLDVKHRQVQQLPTPAQEQEAAAEQAAAEAAAAAAEVEPWPPLPPTEPEPVWPPLPPGEPPKSSRKREDADAWVCFFFFKILLFIFICIFCEFIGIYVISHF